MTDAEPRPAEAVELAERPCTLAPDPGDPAAAREADRTAAALPPSYLNPAQDGLSRRRLAAVRAEAEALLAGG